MNTPLESTILSKGAVSVWNRLNDMGHNIRIIRFAAVIISCLLHLGLILFFLMPSDEQTALQVNHDAQAQLYPNEEQLTTVVFIAADAPHLSDKIPVQDALQSFMVFSSEPELVVTEPTLEIDDRPSEITSAARDRAALATARLAYLSQIQARIERSWDHPLVALDHVFRCQIKIQQTLQGEIKAIKVSNCDGDDEWQQSLLRAIRNAAPFPAPRDERSFVEELTLDFKTEAVSLAALFTLLETLPAEAATPSTQSRP